MGIIEKIVKKQLDVLKNEEVLEAIAKGKKPDNQSFYNDVVTKVVNSLFESAKNNDVDTYCTFFSRTEQVKFLEKSGVTILGSFLTMKKFSELGKTLYPSPYWVFDNENKSKNINFSTLLNKDGEGSGWIEIYLSADQDEKNRIATPGLKLKAEISKKGKFEITDASFENRSDIVGFDSRNFTSREAYKILDGHAA